MVAENLKDYLENGNIRFSVNFPECRLPRMDAYRITYTIVDVNDPVTDEIESKLRAIDGVLTLRNLGKPVT
jgi:D-3-phosphoglycerate dehydrogenase